MIRRRGLVALAAAAVLLAGGCTGDDGTDAAPTISTAPVAPESPFTVQCPEFTDPVTEPGPETLPALSLECLGANGQPVSISGKPPRATIINVWASWCPPCRDEMPLVEQFAKDAAGLVDVLGVVSADSRPASESYALEMGLTFPNVLDPKGQISASQGVPAIPITLFLTEDGKMVQVHIGPFSSVEQIKDEVLANLGVDVP